MAPVDPQAAGHPPTRWGRRLLVGLALLAVLGLSLAAARQWWQGRPGDTDPGNAAPASPSPFRNVVAGVKYVGDDACAECHEGHVKRFRRHPMARSLTAVTDGTGPERYDEKAGNSFTSLGHLFSVERRGSQVIHHETVQDSKGHTVGDVSAAARFVIGSAKQGSSYLVERDGFLTQSPISWFSRKGDRGGWGLSPGFTEGQLHFDRPVTLQCLFCHGTPPAPVENAVNQFHSPLTDTRPMGCERCHGPGELHVQRRKRSEPVEGDVDFTIVNPRHLAPDLREDVCQQCHLQGETRVVRRARSLLDYRPGLPLPQYVSIYVRPPAASEGKAISHVEQMYLSRCFRESKGRMGCVSCHDPHEVPAPDERVGFFRDRCLKCHGETSCHLAPAARRARNKDDSCIDCHMPQDPARNVAHSSFTDHRIVRRRDQPPAPAERRRPDDIPLAHFHRNRVGERDKELSRDLALALTEVARDPCPDAVRQEICQNALFALEQARGGGPEDAASAEARGYALWVLGQPKGALAAAEKALADAPRRELALEVAGRAAAELGRLDASAGYWRRLADANPWRPQYRAYLAGVLVQQRDWQRGLDESRAALRLDPGSVPARRLFITCLLGKGDRGQAKEEFDRLLALDPEDKEQLQKWFDGEAP
jgi:hypothetical protein